MADRVGEVVREVSAAVNERWRRVDPLLPEVPGAIEDGAACLIASGPDGRSAGFAVHRRSWSPDDKLDQTWGPATKFVLRPRIAGPDVADAVDQLLVQWRAHLAAQPGTGDDDTAATLNWPTRDTEGVLPIIRHGMQPITVIAARPGPGRQAAAGRSANPVDYPDGLVVREAGPDDLAAVVDLEMGVVRFDAQFGAAIIRPATERLIHADTVAALARTPSWTWLAERGGRPVGLLVVQPPAQAGWISVATSATPAAYLATLFVRPEQRGGSVGARLVSQAHEALDAAGVALTILHYAQVNPVSGPFWSRMGYRPLWTGWEARPATALR